MCCNNNTPLKFKNAYLTVVNSPEKRLLAKTDETEGIRTGMRKGQENSCGIIYKRLPFKEDWIW